MEKDCIFTPIEAFAAFIMKNIKTIVECCHISPATDFSTVFIQTPQNEELCLMTITHHSSKTLLICQLFNSDSFGLPLTGINEAKKQRKLMRKGRIFVVCPGLYPQVIDNINLKRNPIEFLIVDGSMCEYIPLNNHQ